MVDMVNHPPHYTSNPSGVEVIEITETCSFCVGNAIKYVARHQHKGNPKQDLEKAIFYTERALSNTPKKVHRSYLAVEEYNEAIEPVEKFCSHLPGEDASIIYNLWVADNVLKSDYRFFLETREVALKRALLILQSLTQQV